MKEYAYYKNGTVHSTCFAKNKKQAIKLFSSTFGRDCEVHLHNTEKELLIDKVVEEIDRDLRHGDTTAVFELLKSIPKKSLLAYLPEKI